MTIDDFKSIDNRIRKLHGNTFKTINDHFYSRSQIFDVLETNKLIASQNVFTHSSTLMDLAASVNSFTQSDSFRSLTASISSFQNNFGQYGFVKNSVDSIASFQNAFSQSDSIRSLAASINSFQNAFAQSDSVRNLTASISSFQNNFGQYSSFKNLVDSFNSFENAFAQSDSVRNLKISIQEFQDFVSNELEEASPEADISYLEAVETVSGKASYTVEIMFQPQNSTNTNITKEKNFDFRDIFLILNTLLAALQLLVALTALVDKTPSTEINIHIEKNITINQDNSEEKTFNVESSSITLDDPEVEHLIQLILEKNE